MNERTFDKSIRDRLKDHESAVPTDMWRRIHHKEEDDRKFSFLWTSLAVTAAVAILWLLAGRILRNPATPHSVHLSSAHLADSSVAREASSAAHTNPTSAHTNPTTAHTVPSRPNTAPSSAHTVPTPTQTASSTPNTALTSAHTASPIGPRVTTSHAPDPFTLSAVAIQSPQHPLFRSAPIFAKPLPHGKPNPIPCWDPTRPSHPGTWSLSVYGVSGIAAGAANSVLLYGAGFLLRKDLMYGFSVAAGLQYSRIKIKGLTDSLAPFGTPHLTNLDLPVLVGYEKTYSGFQAAVDGGIMINLRSTPGGQPFLQNFYRTSTGMSLYLGLRFTKELDDRISLFAAPYYRRQLSDPAGNNAPFPQTFNVGGLLIGIKYNFNGRSKP